MLTFTNPSALLALLGLLVPLAIHLWNRRPGREVAVGSLRWLAAVRPRLDSLRRRGYALRWLRQGLPLVSATSWRADSLGQPMADSVGASDAALYWPRIQLAADTFAGQPLYVLTSARLAAMQGTHRPLPPNVTWQTLPLPTETTWLQAAAGTADSLSLLVGRSTERQTTFNTTRVARPQMGQVVTVPGSPSLRYKLNNSSLQPLAAPADSGQAQPAVPVQRATLRIWVYAPPAYAAEARYLRAALRAASAGLPGPLALTVAATLPSSPAAADWLFWLPTAPVPAAWRAQVPRGLHLWQAPPSPGTPDTTLLVAPRLAAELPATNWRRAPLAAPTGTEALWTDAQGRPVLTRQALGQGAIYQAATRLSPTWSTLADNPALPALLLDVLQPTPARAELARFQAHDQRRLDAGQLLAPKRGAASLVIPPAFRLLDLRPWLVLLAGLLLALERWLASRRGASPSLSPA